MALLSLLLLAVTRAREEELQVPLCIHRGRPRFIYHFVCRTGSWLSLYEFFFRFPYFLSECWLFSGVFFFSFVLFVDEVVFSFLPPQKLKFAAFESGWSLL